MKSKLVFVLFIFLTFLMARDIAYVQNNTPLLKAEAEQIVNPIMSSSDRSISSRTDTTTIWFDDLEGDVSGWTNDAEWVLTEVTSNSPTHSFNADDDNYDTDPMLVSPIITLPELIYDTQFIKFSFAVWCNTPDSDGDDDGFLEDYYFVELANVSQTQGIYPDATLERLETPSITLAGTSPVLSFKLNYSIEAYAGDPQTIDGCEINGWDAANVRISTDNGVNWSVLSGTPAYDYSSCYGWSSNADGCNVPGWGGTATAGWADASFDLNAYVGQTVKLGFYFGSDPNTAETGFFLDNVLVTNAASDTIFFDNADDQVNLVPVALNGTTTYFHTDTYEAYENNSWWFGAQDFVWDQIFYDYGDIGRPGGSDIGWQVYMPGDPFNGNTQMDLSAYAGYDVKLRFRARFDDNDDGGNAGGLYIDDIHFWQIDFQEGPPAITGLNAVAGDAVVNVTWNDLNTGGGFNGDVIYDDGSFENAIGLTDPGEAYLGTMFDAPFGVTSITVNTVDIFGYAGATGATNIYGFSVAGGIPDETPLYTQSITTVDDQWVTQSVTGWTFTGDFVIALGTTDLISTAIDENTVPSGHSWSNLGAGWSDWATVA
ncbi:MAG: immune inhibitor A, partial [Candidatus Marinimicrobia bacterium]|nr:immune inhibitor A [Candidatus Neomarinimicrobiota bacterium]